MANIELTQELVRELFDYKDGFLYWKVDRRKTKIGDIAGYILLNKGEKRRYIGILYNGYYASRIIFLWHKGYLPDYVDHIDRDTLNDKIENLRAASASQNSYNTKSHNDSFSKYKGVTLKKSTGRYGANISSNKKYISLGYYKTEEEAALAYNKAAVKYHGEFANLNIIQLSNLS